MPLDLDHERDEHETVGRLRGCNRDRIGEAVDVARLLAGEIHARNLLNNSRAFTLTRMAKYISTARHFFTPDDSAAS